MAPRILLCSSTDWPFPARLAQAFATLGARVEAVCPRTSPLRRSAAPSRLYNFSFLDPLGAIAGAVEKAAPNLVLPCDDLAAEMLWRLGRARADLAPLLARALGDAAVYPVLAARNAFLAQAAAAGITVAENIAIESPADLDRAAARLGFPLVVKTDGYWGGDGVAIARNLDAAKAAMTAFAGTSRLRILTRAIKRREPRLLARLRFPLPARLGAQRFIAGRPATSAIACWQGRLLAAHHFDVAAANGTGPASVVARADCARMQAAAVRLSAHFRLSGLHGLDYMRAEDGRIFLLEINPRATPTSHLALGAGHDLAAALLCAAGYPVPDRPAVTPQARIALFPQGVNDDGPGARPDGSYHDLPLDDPALARALGR